MARALAALRERPALLQVALTELANARHAAVVRSFIDALTRAKGPMEIHAHDPLRYCGDMLAWTHQAVASEKELFAGLFLARSVRVFGLFRLCLTNRRIISEQEGVRAMPPLSEAAVAAALSHAIEGVCRPLRMRVEQVLAAPDLSLVPLFKLGALFQFYSSVLLPCASGGGLLPADAALCLLIADLLTLSRKVFGGIFGCLWG
jgi:hypothetical protein